MCLLPEKEVAMTLIKAIHYGVNLLENNFSLRTSSFTWLGAHQVELFGGAPGYTGSCTLTKDVNITQRLVCLKNQHLH